VTREDITALVLPVLRHRVLTNYFAESDGMDVDKVLTQLLEHSSGDKRQAAVAG
jgi:MoxR-like ATPase